MAIRALVGTLLVAGGALKLTSTPVWRDLWVAAYRLLPGSLVAPVARTLPAAELACGLALLIGVSAAATAASLLLGLFTLAVVSALVRDLKVSCGCFGRLEKMLSWPVAVRNICLTSACAVIAVRGYEAPALATASWSAQLSVLGLLWATVTGCLLAYRRTQQQRHLDNLVRASRIGASTRSSSQTTPLPAKQPATAGGAR